jgi:hypothetical protein
LALHLDLKTSLYITILKTKEKRKLFRVGSLSAQPSLNKSREAKKNVFELGEMGIRCSLLGVERVVAGTLGFLGKSEYFTRMRSQV